ncbi:MAG: hypothetical protein ACSLFB_12085 [Acidimicrobiales bacterium]
MKPRTKSALKLLGICIAVAPALFAGSTTAAFTALTSNTTNSFTADPDWVGPPIPDSILQKTELLTGGFLRSAGTYRIYANVGPDSGNPATGINTVTANVAVAGNVITAGQTAVALATAGGPWIVNGVSYVYRNGANLTAGTLTNADRTYSVTATDLDTPANTVTANFSVTGDITRPVVNGLRTTNAGINGIVEEGDTFTITYSEPIEPQSIAASLSTWDGSSMNVVVRLRSSTGTGADQIELMDSAVNVQLLPDLLTYTDLLNKGTNNYGSTGTPSTMSFNAAMTELTVILGTRSGGGALRTGGAVNMRHTPQTTIFDRAGNTALATQFIETGGADIDF